MADGFSLIEVMIAMTIGLIISLALATMFTKISETNREQFKAAMQIENGRYAVDLLSNTVRLAGYYGEFSAVPPAAASLPDPCAIPAEGNVSAATANSPLAFFIQGYAAATASASATVPTACQAWIDSDTLKPGSDILVVRRLDTIPLIDPPTTTSATPDAGMVYVQTSDSLLDIQYGSGTAIDSSKNAKGAATAAELQRKDFTQALSGTPATRPTIAAYIRKLHVDIYFVANCRSGSGSNGMCTADDDTIPTLKRLELTASGGAATMTVVPLVEGVEFFKAHYGVDTDGNGQVDSGGLSAPATVADWQNVVQVEVRVLARNTESSTGYTDGNSYDLGGGISYTPSGAAAKFRRHAFHQQIYITNVGGRRET
ncbi:MAG: PilW family protein [Rhodocyclaceae bacterium]|jgi:type IV pilus assembly protein PilW|nr:PilW family protein [Rhodocyclaceae bacterium]